MRRKVLSIICALGLCLSLVACGGASNVTSTSTASSTKTSTSVSTSVSASASTETSTDTSVSTSADTDTSASSVADDEISSMEGIMYAYKEIITAVYGELLGDDADDLMGGAGLYDILAYAENPLDRVGYVYTDLNWDYCPELVFVELDEDDYHGKSILSMYTWDGEKAIRMCEGWARSSWYAVGGGTLVNMGSDSASDSSINVYGWAMNTTGFFELNDYHSVYDGDSDQIKYYSLENEITSTEYFEIMDEIVDEALTFATIPMSQYEPECPVIAMYEQEYYANGGQYLDIDAAEGEVYAVFLLEDYAYNFSICQAVMDSSDGWISCKKTSEPELLGSGGPGYGFTAVLTFPGDGSLYIITFTDSSNEMHECLLYLSGKDGSLIVADLYP